VKRGIIPKGDRTALGEEALQAGVNIGHSL